jgi:hypothetical protein
MCRILLVGALLTLACETKKTLDGELVGKWSMSKVYEYDMDVTEQHNPVGSRWIEFNKDGTFESGGEPFGQNAGRWKIDTEQSILYIDSDADDDDSEWKISIEDDQSTWTGIGHPRKENTKLVHLRVSR